MGSCGEGILDTHLFDSRLLDGSAKHPEAGAWERSYCQSFKLLPVNLDLHITFVTFFCIKANLLPGQPRFKDLGIRVATTLHPMRGISIDYTKAYQPINDHGGSTALRNNPKHIDYLTEQCPVLRISAICDETFWVASVSSPSWADYDTGTTAVLCGDWSLLGLSPR